MPGYKKSGGNWLNLAPYGKVSGVWTQAKESFVKKDGTWKQYWLQASSDDSTFNVIDTIPKTFNGSVEDMIIQSDGKILICGYFKSFRDQSRSGIVRLNSDATIDTSFDPGTGAGGNSVQSVKVQSDGKILLGGFFNSFNSISKSKIVRLNSNGSVDSSFNTGTGFSGSGIYSLAIQSDGKIVVVGNFASYTGVSRNHILRLNSDGTLDTSFNVGTGFNAVAIDLAIQPDGKILIVGEFTSYNGTSANRIVRLNSDGTIDSSFNTGTGFDNTANNIIIDSDGTILVGGYISSYNNEYSNKAIRINSDGTKNTSSQLSYFSANDVSKITVRPDGKILIAGLYYNGPSLFGGIRVFNSDGTEDTSFNLSTKFGFAQINSILVKPDNSFFVGGVFSSFNDIPQDYISSFSSSGTFLPTFPSTNGANLLVETSYVQSDGKIIIGGAFSHYNGISSRYIARLNSDGTIDTSFNIGSGFDQQVSYITAQPDGKILVGGSFFNFNGVSRRGIARLNIDGTLDTSFNPGTGINSNWIRDMAIQSDGKIIACGAFNSYNGTTANSIMRLNTDGTIDTSFNSGNGFDSTCLQVNLQSNNKIIASGYFNSYNGTTVSKIARLNTDGSLDTSFNIGSGFDMFTDTIKLQSDGKILVGGRFSSYNGTSVRSLVRLKANGVIDSNFNNTNKVQSGDSIYSISILNNNKILIAGLITKYDNKIRNNVTVIGSDIYVRPPVFTSSPIASPIDATSTTISWGSTGQSSYSITLSPTVSGQPFTGTTATSRFITGLSQLTNYTANIELLNDSPQSTIESTIFSTPEAPAVGPWTTNIITTTGDNSTSSPNINNIYYRRQILMWVYTAAEISSAFGGATSATISKMRFNVTQQPLNQPLPDYAIGMKQGSFAGNPGNTGYTIVKNASSESFTTGAIKVFDFNTPFVWNNQDIAIVTAWGQCPVDWNESGTGPVGSGTSYYSRTDSAGAYVINTDSAGSANNARPVVDFYFTV